MYEDFCNNSRIQRTIHSYYPELTSKIHFEDISDTDSATTKDSFTSFFANSVVSSYKRNHDEDTSSFFPSDSQSFGAPTNISFILYKAKGVKAAKDIRPTLENRLKLWEEGRVRDLVTDLEMENRCRGKSQRQDDDQSKFRAFNTRVLNGCLRSACRALTERDGGGVLNPDDECTNRSQTRLNRGDLPPVVCEMCFESCW
mmetsp:Transcript_18299/g.39325  ORF Transcript_18299/g.39325 Transcript_18299/m.39325 type:complete len:200 (+) Transcript_18299:1-600(+)